MTTMEEKLAEALRLAHDHLEMDKLLISHPRDWALISHALAEHEAAKAQPAEHPDTHAFKNFHQRLCERFDYVHDERDWRRDLVSLEEWIAKRVQDAKAQPAGEREAFEAWAGRVYRNAPSYTKRDYALGFAAWQAARASQAEAQPAGEPTELDEWVRATGAVPFGGSWHYELAAMLKAARAQQAEAQPVAVPAGWRIQRNADGSIGLFAPPPINGESRRTSECFTNKLGNDMNEIVFKFLSHMLAAAPQPAQATSKEGWQPIETAPKDGSTVMLFEQYESEPFFGYWWEGRSRWRASTTHYDTDGNACVIDRVYSEGVTHWMPLPPPPSAQAQQGGEG